LINSKDCEAEGTEITKRDETIQLLALISTCDDRLHVASDLLESRTPVWVFGKDVQNSQFKLTRSLANTGPVLLSECSLASRQSDGRRPKTTKTKLAMTINLAFVLRSSLNELARTGQILVLKPLQLRALNMPAENIPAKIRIWPPRGRSAPKGLIRTTSFGTLWRKRLNGLEGYYEKIIFCDYGCRVFFSASFDQRRLQRHLSIRR
jgi:hypothetical protein